ncbi:MAG: hypothetical protein GY828_08545 [Candidatus Gracilibacteria bacterium]|nr:hypothetical protein [Candidatus Gracilibacteria bacterium]
MSRAKDLLEEIETKKEIASQVAVEAGVLIYCSDCGEYIEDHADYIDAYKHASVLHKNNDEKIRIFSDRKELLDYIKSACEESFMDCNCPEFEPCI